MNVAMYVRRSTNERLQADSLVVQEEILRRYAKDHEMKVVAIFRDSASGTSVKHRKAFLQLVEKITHGAHFEAVLVRDVSRFGRFYDIDEGAFFEVLFLSHRVRTIYCEEVFTDNVSPMAGLIKGVRRVMASEYSKEKARLIRYAQARSTALGFHSTAKAPYGLKRVMVTLRGEFVQDLAVGEWKALANHRVTLVPGDPSEVAVVLRIFREFFEDGLTPTKIARKLNADGIPSPDGWRWQVPTITGIFGNPRYAGISQYCPAKPLSPGDKEASVVRGRYAGPQLISVAMWEAVQKLRMSAVRWLPNAVLAADIRAAYLAQGVVNASILSRAPRRYNERMIATRFEGGLFGALAEAFSSEIMGGRRILTDILAPAFRLRADDDGWIIDGALTVAFRPAFLRELRWGRHWTIRAAGIERDLVISFGVHPDGRRTRDFYVIRQAFLHSPSSTLRAVDRYQVDADRLTDRIAVLCRTSLPSVEEAFLAAARSRPMLSLARISREFGWPAHAVRRTYHRLVARGEWMPPAKNAVRPWVEHVCAGCGRSRWERLALAVMRTTDRCRGCTNVRRRIEADRKRNVTVP